MVDEASMVATADLDRIRGIVETAGARMVLIGDPRQLGAVEAGGVMGLLDGHAETYTLTDVRRFTAAWEAEASLRLRDGDRDALADYDRHGRLRAHESVEEAVESAARAAVADRLDRRSVVVVTDTNEQAAAIATSVRNQLIALGLVQEEDGVLLGRDSCTAGVGDLIAARRNDYRLGVTNRAQYRITAINADGSITVVPADRATTAMWSGLVETSGSDVGSGARRAPIVLPASYVEADVQLGYASTVHAAQGLTVDAAHLVSDGGLDASGLYVALSRGRLRNTAHVALTAATHNGTRPAATTASGGQVRLEDAAVRPSARVVLEASLEREVTNRAASVEAELDAARLASMDVLAGRYEAVVRTACRERLDRHLDELTTDGVLDPGTRARLGADQGTEHLARLLRAIEQAGDDPRQTLTDAIAARSLTDAGSVAQVLSHRITGGRPLPHPIPAAHDPGHGATRAGMPGDIPPRAVQHLRHLAARIQQRQTTLGEHLTHKPPRWALTCLGPVPADGAARAAWQQRAGIVAGHREATGWDHPEQPLGAMPGIGATEQRASYAAAWEALGRPDTSLDEAAMTEGQLRIRVRAGQTERAWAPAHADAALRATETAHENARQAAAIARALADQAKQAGDIDAADCYTGEAVTHGQTAAVKAAAIQPLTTAADARARWAASTAPTFEQEQRAQAELERRGLSIGQEPDRTTFADWYAAERAAREADDAHRVITETDLATDTEEAAELAPSVSVEDLDQLPEAAAPDQRWDQDTPHPRPQQAATDAATAAADRPEDDRSITDQSASNQVAAGERGWGRSPAHATVREDISVPELDAVLAGSAFAVAKAADRASQEAAHVEPADLDDTSAADDSYDAERHRRDASDEHTTTLGDAAAAGHDVSADDA
jgi:hypothetical protein